MRKIIIIVLLLTISCKPAKVTVITNDTNMQYKQVKEDTIVKQNHSTTNKIDTGYTTITKMEPVDAKQPMVINGIEYKNIRFKTTKIKKAISISKHKKSVLNQRKQETNKIELTNKRNKTVTENKSKWLLYLYIALVMVVAGFVINKIL
jgi:hypothetical protein